jgi:hypothetical protein
MANQNKLKAWVRYDGTNTVVTAGPIFRASKPKVGNWKQINADLCCNGSLTTTTTTTNGGGGTPTAWVGYSSGSSFSACQQVGGTSVVLYTSVSTLVPGTFLYTDAALTQFYSSSLGFVPVAINGVVWQISEGDGSIINPQNCSSITTTTSTTQTPVNSALFGESSSSFFVCTAVASLTLYWIGELTNGTQIFTDQALTQPYLTIGFVVNSSTNAIFSTSNGFAFNNGFC